MAIWLAILMAIWQIVSIDSDSASVRFEKKSMRKKFDTQQEAEAFQASLHPILEAEIVRRAAVTEKTETRREADESHDAAAALESAIERGDSLAQNALEFFRGTMWGQEHASGDRSFYSALTCVDLDVSDYDYRPAQSHAQAVKFVKRLWAAVKWIKTYTTVPAVPECWYVDVDSDIGLQEKYSSHCSHSEAEKDLEHMRANGLINDPLARIIEHEDGFLKFRLVWMQKFSIRQRRMDSQYDPSDSVSGWGNAFGD